MDLIGRVFFADRISIFERDAQQKLVNTYKWSSEHVPGEPELSGSAAGLDISALPLQDKQTVYLNTNQIESPILRQWFAGHGARAAITCCMKEQEEFATAGRPLSVQEFEQQYF